MKDAPINLPPTEKLYADRQHDTPELRDLYCKHVMAMTAEGLHAKSDIAAELAWRDHQIAELRAAILADRAGREEKTPHQDPVPVYLGGNAMEGWNAAPSPAEPHPAHPEVLCSYEPPARMTNKELGARLRKHRQAAIHKGMTLMSIDEINAEVAARRGAEPPAAPVQQEPVAHIQHSRDGVWLHLDFGVSHKLSLNLSADEFNRKFALAYAAKYPTQDAVLHPLYTHPSADLRAELDKVKEAFDLSVKQSGRFRERFESAEAERDALKVELAETLEGARIANELCAAAQAELTALRAQASLEAVALQLRQSLTCHMAKVPCEGCDCPMGAAATAFDAALKDSQHGR